MSSSLSDRIDTLAATARAIRASAVAAVAPSQDFPFTRAVLDTPLGDLIRDVDASELGLFTIIPAPDADVRTQADTRRGEVSRVEFPGATPLRSQTKRGGPFRPKEYEPEVYAHAALKYLDRYQSIRRMPRARAQVVAIIDQLDDARENIKRLEENLQELTTAVATSAQTPSISSVVEEERQITDLQNRLVELRNQKDAILRSNESKQTTKPKTVSKTVPKPALSPSPEPVDHEDVFWSTPVASARTLRFTDRLLEEEPDFAQLSALSFDSPGPAPPKSVLARLAAGGISTKKDGLTEDNVFGTPGYKSSDDLHDESSLLEDQLEPEHDLEPFPDELDVNTEDNLDEEGTVVLKRVSPSAPADPPPSGDRQPQTMPLEVDVQSCADSSLKSTRVRITPELENIVSRIWSTVGEILLSGKGGEKPLRAKETLALLESLTTQTPSPVSSTSSMSSIASATTGPTPHQLYTAQLLYALLAAPNHAMPLNQLKSAIGNTRALYACVAKKLIRIDRGGGEQVVLFDA